LYWYKHIFIVLTLLLTWFLPAITASAPHVKANTQASVLNQKLDALIKEEPLFYGAMVGISIRNQQTGELIYDHLGSMRLRPASNLKLLTAASALEVLGENHTFSTKLYVDGSIAKGKLNGNLILQGGGDPTLQQADLKEFARIVKEMGIKRISGKVIGDDTRYDDIRYSIDMPWSDEEAYYGAEISPLTVSPDKDYDAGTVVLEVKPAKKVGEKVSYTIKPENTYIKVVNEAVTSERDSKEDLTFSREHSTNTITISGQIPQGSTSEREWIAVSNASKFVVHLFVEELKKAGIKVDGGYRLGVTPSQASLINEHKSISLSELLLPFMKLSNNGHGEILMKEMGKVVKGTGSFEAGLAVMNEKLTPLGVDFSNQLIRDGSGISHVNLIQPNDLTELLFSIQSKSWFPSYFRSLPVAGEKEQLVGGTLRYRMKEEPLIGNVVAKTGTLTTVSSISGYVNTKTKGNLIFSILINNVMDEDKAKKVEDRIIAILANQ
jgi:serine-type D-Ala-D-Ala carboxypeptidase/endopeptidase (penicillin-binding protein 4)